MSLISDDVYGEGQEVNVDGLRALRVAVFAFIKGDRVECGSSLPGVCVVVVGRNYWKSCEPLAHEFAGLL